MAAPETQAEKQQTSSKFTLTEECQDRKRDDTQATPSNSSKKNRK